LTGISIRAVFREIFNLVDRDGGGSISKEELGQLMETLGIHASPDEIDLMVNEIDKNNDGEIQFEARVSSDSVVRAPR
jgi:calmodulin